MSLSQDKTFAVAQPKKRQAKATSAQIDAMVDYFIKYPHVASGKFQSLHGKQDLTGSWEALADDLNRMGKDGRTKDVKSWKSTWRDNKTAVSQKMAKLRAHKVATGNVGGPPAQLTKREKKIVGLIGLDYVEGLPCPDAFPEEQECVMELLADGRESPLNVPAGPLTLRNSEADYLDLEVLDDSTVDNLLIATSETPVGVTPPLQQPTFDRRVSRKFYNTPNAKRHRRQRLSSQVSHANENFASLAERQVACMEMIAKAMQSMANNERRRDEILREFVETQKANEETCAKLVDVLKDYVDTLKK